MTYNLQELEGLLRNNRIENSRHKEALRQQLFGSARYRSSAVLPGTACGAADAELSEEELAMAAGGLNAKPLRGGSEQA